MDNDNDVVNRFYMLYSGTAPTAAQMVTLATAIATSWNTRLAEDHTAHVQLTNVTCEDLTSATGAVGTAAVSHAGTNGQLPNPAGVAALLNFTISRRYRGGKPRLYLPAFGQSDVNNAAVWKATSAALLLTDFNLFITDILAMTWTGATITEHVNVSFYSGFSSYQNPVTMRWHNVSKPRLSTVGFIDNITSVAVNLKFGSQRRRNLH